MKEFDDNKGKRTAGRDGDARAAVKPGDGRAAAQWIGKLLHRRYDSTLVESLPGGFANLLSELDRKLPDKQRR